MGSGSLTINGILNSLPNDALVINLDTAKNVVLILLESLFTLAIPIFYIYIALFLFMVLTAPIIWVIKPILNAKHG